MSEFKSLKQAFDQRKIVELAKAKNVDLNSLPSKADLERRTIDYAHQKLREEQATFYYNNSVWAGDELHFTFEQWNPSKQKDSQLAREIGKQAFIYAEQLKIKQFNVILLGDPRVGKTSLAMAMLDKLQKADKSIMFVSTAELAGLISNQYDFPDVKAKLQRIEKSMKKVDVLLLDDFGTEGGQVEGKARVVRKDMQDFMYRIANARCKFNSNTAGHITIITTNNNQQEINTMYDGKIVSRLFPKPGKTSHRITFNKMGDVRNVD
ncbi:DNA replication protein [Ligilactobacillus salitolerans]|uniref:DNA replication protein n=1 Tax=Ligilactobacillus salitolerans TaxID=1808352 RepID=A0A401IUJ5_9LACO|nr:ATP-binding protein [Ligilactobacillus salitolerans]GBG95211.1 DNA replication protein [Ligilactobacillus salitolerans]